MSEPFTFGIPLIGRSAARDWVLVEHLLALTLRSVRAQEDQDFRVLLAAHETPGPWQLLAGDPRFTVLAADWPVQPPTSANDDGGRKKWLIKQRVREAGGGLLMFLDADDWVPRELVRVARAQIRPDQAGAVLGDGFALDFASGKAMRFPITGAFEGAFHQLCGSSTIGRIVPGAADPLGADPHATLGSHHQWPEAARSIGASLAWLELPGAYLVGTGENHSEHHGPLGEWRRQVTRAVRLHGRPLEAEQAARFGQELDVRPGEHGAAAIAARR